MRTSQISINSNCSDIVLKSPNASTDDVLIIIEKKLIDKITINDSISKQIIDTQTTDTQNKDTQTLGNDIFKLLQLKAAQANQEKYNCIIDNLVSELVTDLKEFTHDAEYFAVFEHHVCNIEHEYSFTTMGTVLQSIYVKYNDQPKMLVGICRVLCRYDLQEVMPWGPTMLSGLLNNKSELVKEYAIELVDNWADVSMLPLLKSLDISSKWLRAYLQDVIKSLEE